MTAETIIIIIISVINGILLGFHAGREYENKKLTELYKPVVFKFKHNKEIEDIFNKSKESDN